MSRHSGAETKKQVSASKASTIRATPKDDESTCSRVHQSGFKGHQDMMSEMSELKASFESRMIALSTKELTNLLK